MLTRTDGANREDHADARLVALPEYERDEDCSLDSTYAEWYYHVTDDARVMADAIVSQGYEIDQTFSERFDELMKT